MRRLSRAQAQGDRFASRRATEWDVYCPREDAFWVTPNTRSSSVWGQRPTGTPNTDVAIAFTIAALEDASPRSCGGFTLNDRDDATVRNATYSYR
jgi:hypothetical protein